MLHMRIPLQFADALHASLHCGCGPPSVKLCLSYIVSVIKCHYLPKSANIDHYLPLSAIICQKVPISAKMCIMPIVDVVSLHRDLPEAFSVRFSFDVR